MLNKLFLICILLMTSIIGCQQSGDTLDPPSAPGHTLQIEGEVQLGSQVSWVDSTHELKTKIWAINLDSDTATIETGPCAFNLLAYSMTENPKRLVWYNKMPEEYICQDELLSYTIPPNDTLPIKGQAYLDGSSWYWSVPKGEWQFVIEAKTEDGQTIRVKANRVTIH